jgi:hypothetical protein
MAAPLLFAAAVALGISSHAPQAQAQPKFPPPEEETFLTADGVQLRGLFHKSQKTPANDPVVILLYSPGKDNSMIKGDWDGLANRLAESGYNVFRFDWRGHGKSVDIKDTTKFWTNPYTGPWNQKCMKGANSKPIKDTIYFKDLGPNAARYAPVYLTDLAAARAHLDSKNDAGDVNTSSVYLIGSELGATIGMGWLAAEWNRPAFSPTPNQLLQFPRYEYVPQPLNGGITTPAGEDISASVWLTPTHPTSIPDNVIKGWVTGALPTGKLPMPPKTRENNPMLFMYGEKDTRGKREAEFFHLEVLVGRGNKMLGLSPLNEKYLSPVKNGGALSGVALLGDNQTRGTEDTIMKFMDAIQKERKQLIRKSRGFTSPYFIELTSFGVHP